VNLKDLRQLTLLSTIDSLKRLWSLIRTLRVVPNKVLEARDIRKTFRDHSGCDVYVLGGVSFDLEAGTVTSLLGASGCGKTTLLRILAGLDFVDSGSIKALVDLPGPQVGFVRQGDRLLPWRTLLGNVSLGLELLGVSKGEASLASLQALSSVGLADYAEWFPRQISGGMTQRILLARALVSRPALLLLDEPLGQLDIVARQELASIIRGYVRATDAAALLVTHSVEEAVFISDSVLTLSLRPARVSERFVLRDAQVSVDGTQGINREEAFATVQSGLLKALREGEIA
jgi:NitT/TauT family transport system ATP-binding protein